MAEPSDVLGPELHVQSSGQLAATGRMVFFSHPGVRGRAACSIWWGWSRDLIRDRGIHGRRYVDPVWTGAGWWAQAGALAGRSPVLLDEQMLGAVGDELEGVGARGYPQLGAVSPRVPLPLSFG